MNSTVADQVLDVRKWLLLDSSYLSLLKLLMTKQHFQQQQKQQQQPLYRPFDLISHSIQKAMQGF